MFAVEDTQQEKHTQPRLDILCQNVIGHAAVGGLFAGAIATGQGNETFTSGCFPVLSFIQFFTLFSRIACFSECLFQEAYCGKVITFTDTIRKNLGTMPSYLFLFSAYLNMLI